MEASCARSGWNSMRRLPFHISPTALFWVEQAGECVPPCPYPQCLQLRSNLRCEEMLSQTDISWSAKAMCTAPQGSARMLVAEGPHLVWLVHSLVHVIDTGLTLTKRGSHAHNLFADFWVRCTFWLHVWNKFSGTMIIQRKVKCSWVAEDTETFSHKSHASKCCHLSCETQTYFQRPFLFNLWHFRYAFGHPSH